MDTLDRGGSRFGGRQVPKNAPNSAGVGVKSRGLGLLCAVSFERSAQFEPNEPAPRVRLFVGAPRLSGRASRRRSARRLRREGRVDPLSQLTQVRQLVTADVFVWGCVWPRVSGSAMTLG